MSATDHCRKTSSGLSQSLALLIREREKNAPFSNYLSTNELDYIPVERFLNNLRFENRGKLDDLGLEIDKMYLNLVISGSSPISIFPKF